VDLPEHRAGSGPAGVSRGRVRFAALLMAALSFAACSVAAKDHRAQLLALLAAMAFSFALGAAVGRLPR